MNESSIHDTDQNEDHKKMWLYLHLDIFIFALVAKVTSEFYRFVKPNISTVTTCSY